MRAFRFAAVAAASVLMAACAGEPAKTDSPAAADSNATPASADTASNRTAQTSATPAAEPGTAAPAVASPAPAAQKAANPAATAEAKPSAAKPAATKPATKPAASTTPSNSQLPEASPVANTTADPFSLVSQAQGTGELLPTYGSDIDDVEVAPHNLDRWAASSRDYAGAYYGPLGSEISNAEVAAAGQGNLNITLGYQAEIANDDGMIEQKQGEATARGIQPQGSIVQWSKLPRIYVTQGQFVQWSQAGRTERGLLVSGTAAGKPAYVLLRKSKTR